MGRFLVFVLNVYSFFFAYEAGVAFALRETPQLVCETSIVRPSALMRVIVGKKRWLVCVLVMFQAMPSLLLGRRSCFDLAWQALQDSLSMMAGGLSNLRMGHALL